MKLYWIKFIKWELFCHKWYIKNSKEENEIKEKSVNKIKKENEKENENENDNDNELKNNTDNKKEYKKEIIEKNNSIENNNYKKDDKSKSNKNKDVKTVLKKIILYWQMKKIIKRIILSKINSSYFINNVKKSIYFLKYFRYKNINNFLILSPFFNHILDNMTYNRDKNSTNDNMTNTTVNFFIFFWSWF